MIDKKNITGIILAGGKSSRMGTDKGLIMFKGMPFFQHIANALHPLVGEIIVISNHSAYDIFGFKRFEDLIKNAGPLAGVYTGLKHSKTEFNLVLSCDVPLINTGTLNKLIDSYDNNSEVIQIESKGKTMPLIALYKKQCEYHFFKLLQEGERRLQYGVNQCKVKSVSLDAENDVFTNNINTPEQLKAIRQ
ncbi:molybdenum cofactor guanylyltransferase [Snuella sedimenti]|uniref:Probable molybdenum cofactor guanylyltransferase n=1 Tax=Snuella sedimenti TaxID=2798802 RepID=A0A8J7JA92_9FLAO|nr:molybdenum cofactor guanylyltransferase [Snuella sedimenti]MBJ6367264.1 molybdenum cofactor guanylyltransferase [Snuella sedimenti]